MLTKKQNEVLNFLRDGKEPGRYEWFHRSEMPYCQNRVLDVLREKGLVERGHYHSEYRAL